MTYKPIKQKDLEKLRPEIENAAQAWKAANKITFQVEHKGKDIGSCVLGDGICVEVIPNGCRKPRRHMIISSSEVSFCQGSLHYESNYKVAIDILKKALLDPYYYYGILD